MLLTNQKLDTFTWIPKTTRIILASGITTGHLNGVATVKCANQLQTKVISDEHNHVC